MKGGKKLVMGAKRHHDKEKLCRNHETNHHFMTTSMTYQLVKMFQLLVAKLWRHSRELGHKVDARIQLFKVLLPLFHDVHHVVLHERGTLEGHAERAFAADASALQIGPVMLQERAPGVREEARAHRNQLADVLVGDAKRALYPFNLGLDVVLEIHVGPRREAQQAGYVLRLDTQTEEIGYALANGVNGVREEARARAEDGTDGNVGAAQFAEQLGLAQ